MELGLQGKRALVTGSTAGIGLAIAIELAREGAAVWVNGRTGARVEQAVRQVEAAAGASLRVRGVAADLATAEGAARVISAAPELDVLVNNVGIFEAKPFARIPDEDWTHFLEVNVLSGVRLSRHHLPRMLQRGSGRILFISSESALQIPAEMIHYGVTKTAQLGLARGMAELTAARAVTVTGERSGVWVTEGLARQQGKSGAEVERDFFQSARPSSLLQRFETPEEIAALVTFVASERASGVNGAALRVDGGVVRAIA